jgi:hypothetical protein
MPFFYAAVLMTVIFFIPEGMAGLLERSKRVGNQLFKKKAKHA